MRTFLSVMGLWPLLAFGQIPDQGRFDYVIYDNGDRPVGSYFFTIRREGRLWRISSEMSVDTRFLLFRIRFRDQNNFTHDGSSFQSFHVSYFKDVPLQRTVQLEVFGERSGETWTIRSTSGGNAGPPRIFPRSSFEEVRNLISRLVRPEAVLQPGQIKRTLSLDPLNLEISEVESRGVAVESIEFQGRRREVFVMDIRASDGNARVMKFANGLIYRSQTEDGYALLKSAETASF